VVQMPPSCLPSAHATNGGYPLFGQNVLCDSSTICLFTIWLALEICPARGDEVCAVRLQAALPKAEVRRSTRAASRAASRHQSHLQQHAPAVSQPPSPGTPPEPLFTAHQDPHLTHPDPTQPTAQQAQHAEGKFETGADHATPADGSEMHLEAMQADGAAMQLEAMQADDDNGDAVPVGTAEQADTEQALQQSQMHTQLTSQEAQEAGLQEGEEAQLALALQPSQEQGETSLSVLNLSCVSMTACTYTLLSSILLVMTCDPSTSVSLGPLLQCCLCSAMQCITADPLTLSNRLMARVHCKTPQVSNKVLQAMNKPPYLCMTAVHQACCGHDAGGSEDERGETLSDMSDMDMSEFIVHDEDEIRQKEQMWNTMNRDYLEKQEMKKMQQEEAHQVGPVTLLYELSKYVFAQKLVSHIQCTAVWSVHEYNA